LLLCFPSHLYVCSSALVTQHFLAGDDAKCEKLEREFSSARSEKVSQRTTSTLQLEQVRPSNVEYVTFRISTIRAMQENSDLEALLTSLMQEPPHKTALQNEKVRIPPGV
jgi:hypothetical protein